MDSKHQQVFLDDFSDELRSIIKDASLIVTEEIGGSFKYFRPTKGNTTVFVWTGETPNKENVTIQHRVGGKYMNPYFQNGAKNIANSILNKYKKIIKEEDAQNHDELVSVVKASLHVLYKEGEDDKVQVPGFRRQIGIMKIMSAIKTIMFTATPALSERLKIFGYVTEGEKMPESYLLMVDPRYDFDEVIDYISYLSEKK